MKPKTVTVDSTNTPYVIPLDYHVQSTNIQAIVTGTINYDVDYTAENIYAYTDPATSASWTAVSGMAGATASASAFQDGSINAIKIVVNSGSGSVKVNVSQSDIPS
jgi:hypothetical protein